MNVIRSVLMLLAFVFMPICAVYAQAGETRENQSQVLPNPYKLDLRKASEKDFNEAISYGSTLGVTIVVYSAQEAPWLLSLDAAELLAKDGITVIVARANDEDDNPKDANIIFVAQQKARQKVTLSTRFKTMFYDFWVKQEWHLRLRDTALSVHNEYFEPD